MSYQAAKRAIAALLSDNRYGGIAPCHLRECFNVLIEAVEQQKGGTKMNVEALKNFEVAEHTAIELVAMATEVAALIQSLGAYKMEAPYWLIEKHAEIGEGIKVRRQAERHKKIKDLRQQAESLKTPAEKKADIEKQIEALIGVEE